MAHTRVDTNSFASQGGGLTPERQPARVRGLIAIAPLAYNFPLLSPAISNLLNRRLREGKLANRPPRWQGEREFGYGGMGGQLRPSRALPGHQWRW